MWLRTLFSNEQWSGVADNGDSHEHFSMREAGP